jgi:tetratricopeptide (TPR) repeat protein
VLQQQGKHQDALQAFDKAVQLKPDDAELWKSLANVLLDLQRYDHALLSLQHVLKLEDATRDYGRVFEQVRAALLALVATKQTLAPATIRGSGFDG